MKAIAIDTRFAQSLLAVIEEGSLAAAARRQGITAAALAQRMQTLERLFGTRLVQRSGQTVLPTAAAQRLVPRLQKIVEDTRRLASDMDPTGLSGPYRLGAISTALADYAVDIVRNLSELAPRCSLTIVPGDSQSLLRRLAENKIDAAIIVRPPNNDLKTFKTISIVAQPYVMVAPNRPDSPEELIIYDRSAWGGMLAWEWIASTMPDAKIVCEMDDPANIAILAASGLGRAVLPNWRALADITGLLITKLPHAPNRQIILATRNEMGPIDRLVVEATK